MHPTSIPSPLLRQRLAVRLLSLLLAAWLAGCAYTPHRTSAEPCTVNAPQPDGDEGHDWEAAADGSRPCADRWQVAVEKPLPFSMNFVEINEQGMLVDRAQAEAALDNASRPAPDGSYVVVFVHGWHHNASSADDNVKGFYKAMALVSRWNPQRQVKGIYIGWRGDSLPVPLLRYLTFWERKNTSDEVGRGSLLEFLLQLERGVKTKPAQGVNNRLVVIGHSFGASVTFNALAHLTMERFLDGVHASGPGPRFRGYGDLVVLVNPAIEAMRFMPLQSAMHHYAKPLPDGRPPLLDFSKETKPAVVILSSEGDWATRKTFRAARLFSTALETHDNLSADGKLVRDGPYSEWVMDRETVGNFAGFQTHETLELAREAGPAAAAALRKVERCATLTGADVWARLQAPHDDPAVFPDSLFKVRRKEKSLAPNNSPYIVAATSTDIVRDHTRIGGAHLMCWINQLLDTREHKERELLTDAESMLGGPVR
jgi:pimeloyl-ACP methyl ester carboxylesterase